MGIHNLFTRLIPQDGLNKAGKSKAASICPIQGQADTFLLNAYRLHLDTAAVITTL